MRDLPAVASTIPALSKSLRSSSDSRSDIRDLRGLLHEVGHGLAALSLLLEVGRADEVVHADPVLDLIEQETARLLGIVHGGSQYTEVPVKLRDVLGQIAELADSTQDTTIRLRPGLDVFLGTDPILVGRVVSNLVDSAVRAAGPDGDVEIVLSQDKGDDEDAGGVIDVIDDGPGRRQGGLPGVSNLGLSVVNRLLSLCGGRLEVSEVRPHGTRMRVRLPNPEARPTVHRFGGRSPVIDAIGVRVI
jgi:signal transduction histidine kinase